MEKTYYKEDFENIAGMKTLVFKWTVSRGRDTYGYNICSLWVDGRKVASCGGGGYDMKGTCFGDYIEANYQDRLQKLNANYGSGDNTKGFYGLVILKEGKRLNRYKKGATIRLDGACGFDNIRRIAEKIGLKLEYIHGSKNETIYTITDNREK
jgi:hypothetical protein